MTPTGSTPHSGVQYLVLRGTLARTHPAQITPQSFQIFGCKRTLEGSICSQHQSRTICPGFHCSHLPVKLHCRIRWFQGCHGAGGEVAANHLPGSCNWAGLCYNRCLSLLPSQGSLSSSTSSEVLHDLTAPVRTSKHCQFLSHSDTQVVLSRQSSTHPTRLASRLLIYLLV